MLAQRASQRLRSRTCTRRMPDRPKRHHQLPRTYLNRFGLSETVRVRRRDGKAYETSTLNVAVESGFYDVPDERGGKSSRVEETLPAIDAAAAEAMAAIDRTGQTACRGLGRQVHPRAAPPLPED